MSGLGEKGREVKPTFVPVATLRGITGTRPSSLGGRLLGGSLLSLPATTCAYLFFSEVNLGALSAELIFSSNPNFSWKRWAYVRAELLALQRTLSVTKPSLLTTYYCHTIGKAEHYSSAVTFLQPSAKCCEDQATSVETLFQFLRRRNLKLVFLKKVVSLLPYLVRFNGPKANAKNH